MFKRLRLFPEVTDNVGNFQASFYGSRCKSQVKLSLCFLVRRPCNWQDTCCIHAEVLIAKAHWLLLPVSRDLRQDGLTFLGHVKGQAAKVRSHYHQGHQSVHGKFRAISKVGFSNRALLKIGGAFPWSVWWPADGVTWPLTLHGIIASRSTAEYQVIYLSLHWQPGYISVASGNIRNEIVGGLRTY